MLSLVFVEIETQAENTSKGITKVWAFASINKRSCVESTAIRVSFGLSCPWLVKIATIKLKQKRKRGKNDFTFDCINARLMDENVIADATRDRASCIIAKTGTQVIVPRPKKRGQDRACLFPRKYVFSGMRDHKSSLMERERERPGRSRSRRRKKSESYASLPRLINRDRTGISYSSLICSLPCSSFSEYSRVQ